MSSTCPDENDLQTNYSSVEPGESIHFGFSKCAVQRYSGLMALVTNTIVAGTPLDRWLQEATCRPVQPVQERRKLNQTISTGDYPQLT